MLPSPAGPITNPFPTSSATSPFNNPLGRHFTLTSPHKRAASIGLHGAEALKKEATSLRYKAEAGLRPGRGYVRHDVDLGVDKMTDPEEWQRLRRAAMRRVNELGFACFWPLIDR